jgi:pimeloyl-ACP methyl ester carboxylesterase
MPLLSRIHYILRPPILDASTPLEARTAPPILFLHGALGTYHEFDKLAPTFQERTQLLLDFPTHGASSSDELTITTERLAVQVLELLDTLEIASVDIIGYSLGAYVGLRMAQQARPRVRSIVAHAMKFYWNTDAITLSLAAFSLERIKQNPKFYDRLLKLHSGNLLAHTLAGASSIVRSFEESQLTIREIQDLKIPLLLSLGDQDELIPLAEVLDLFQALGQAHTSLAIHANTRHPIHLLAPDSFEDAVRQFWKHSLKESSRETPIGENSKLT